MTLMQANGITPKGKAWEWMHSLWMIWALVPLLNGVGFFYIAARVKRIKWLVWGLVYEVPLVLFPIFYQAPTQTWQKTASLSAILLLYIASIIHSFVARKEYLTRLSASGQQAIKQDEALTENIVSTTPEQESSLSEQEEAVPESVRAKGVFEGALVEPLPTELPDTQFPGQEEQPMTPLPVPGSATEEVATALEPIEPPTQAPTLAPLTLATGDGLIDLNHATEEEIATLPGIGMIYAKRAVSEREAMGGFQSLEQFAQKLGFKPHVAQRIQHLVTLTPMKKE